MRAKRQRLTRALEEAVAMASRRRCCLCVYLDNLDEVRHGQIAHLNRDRSDARYENLVFLCLQHHDQYDSRPRQSKGLMEGEVRRYRDLLYAKYPKLGATALKRARRSQQDQVDALPDTSQYQKVRRRHRKKLGFLIRPWRYPLWCEANQPEYFAFKAGNGSDGICLVERVDLPDGRVAIICIQTAGNPGNSITNCVEEICFQVCERFEIPAEKLIWLEHYDDDSFVEWNLVTFARHPPDHPFEEPRWTTMTPALWSSLRLSPKQKLVSTGFTFESKVKKHFEWPPP